MTLFGIVKTGEVVGSPTNLKLKDVEVFFTN